MHHVFQHLIDVALDEICVCMNWVNRVLFNREAYRKLPIDRNRDRRAKMVMKEMLLQARWIKVRSGRAFIFWPRDTRTEQEGRMQLTSSDFQTGGRIPIRFTCEGDDISPEFSWRDAPRETQSFVLMLHDPDAPKAGGFTHWVVYNIPASVGHMEQNVPKQPSVPGLGSQGKNDGGKIGYMGPCPPSGTHHYFAKLFALDTELRLEPGASHEKVWLAMERHILDQVELMGIYAKKAERAA